MSHKLLVKDPRGQREILLVGTMTVGRDPRCDISDADPLLSRRHAEFVVSDGGVVVRDLNSRNGILVNGRKVPQAPLQPGDVVQISGLAITLISTRPKAPPPQADEPNEDKTLLVTPLPPRHTPGTLATPGDRLPSADSRAGGDAADEPATQPGNRSAGQVAASRAVESSGPAVHPAPASAPGVDGTVRIPRHAAAASPERAAGPDHDAPAATVVVRRSPVPSVGPGPSGTPGAASTVVVSRWSAPSAGTGPAGAPAAVAAATEPSPDAGTVYTPRPAATPKEAAASAGAPPSGGTVDPTADGPIEKVLGAGAVPVASAGERPAVSSAGPIPGPVGESPKAERPPSGVPPVDVPAAAAGVRPAAGPPAKPEAPEDGDGTRYMVPPGPVTDLPLRPVAVPAAPVAGSAGDAAPRPAVFVVTPVRAPSKASGPWAVGVMAASMAATIVAALAGAAAVVWAGRTGLAATAAVVAGIVGGVVAGFVVHRRFVRAMQAMTDDLDLAVIGRLEEVGDPFGDPRGRQLADAINELLARIRTGRS